MLSKNIDHRRLAKALNWFWMSLIFLSSSGFSIAQQTSDQLFLVASITGESDTNRIISATGIGDINGDGFADFIVNRYCGDSSVFPIRQAIYYLDLHLGSSDFNTVPDFTFNYTWGYPIGDVNNDSYDDLMLVQKDYNTLGASFKIIFGGTELDTIPQWSYQPPNLWKMQFSQKIEDIGDLNGDGYRDFAIASQYNWDDGKGRVYIFHGGETLSEEPAQVIFENKEYLGTSVFGSSVTGIGDYNNDGFDDILISVPTLDGDSNYVSLYYGGSAINTYPDFTLQSSNYDFGRYVKNLRDINNNGSTEFFIDGSLYFSLNNVINLNTIDEPNNAGGGGDINKDSYNDFLMGGYEFRNDSIFIIVKVFYGNSTVDTLEDIKICLEQPFKHIAYGMLPDLNIAGDINNDGYDDLIMMALLYKSDNIDVGKIYIYSYNNIDDVDGNDITTTSFSLSQNYPNPFNPETNFLFNITAISSVKIELYDVLGEKIASLLNDQKSAGQYKYNLNSGDYNLSSGIYFITIKATPVAEGEIFQKTIKIVLMK